MGVGDFGGQCDMRESVFFLSCCVYFLSWLNHSFFFLLRPPFFGRAAL